MADKPPFSGAGFSRDPLDEEELASHREAHREFGEAWPTITGLDRMAKGAATVRNVVIVAAVVGGAVAWAVKQGLI